MGAALPSAPTGLVVLQPAGSDRGAGVCPGRGLRSGHGGGKRHHYYRRCHLGVFWYWLRGGVRGVRYVDCGCTVGNPRRPLPSFGGGCLLVGEARDADAARPQLSSVPVASPDRIAGEHLQLWSGHRILDARLPAADVRGHEPLVR